LSLARDTIDYAFKNSAKMLPIDENTIPENLKQKRGVFVTLNENNNLRGCIGYIEPIEKLYKAVQLNALSASFEDTRFSPLLEKELKDVKIEISILTVPQETEFKNIKKNIDGVVLKNGRYGATYLPQVWENVSDEGEFFGSLCQKAGLDWNCYKEKETKFSTYQVEILRE
jgi:AmmeMemoRadiSam system protein A